MRGTIALALICALLGACSDDEAGGSDDVAADTGADAPSGDVSDSGGDAPSDTAGDPAADAGDDVAPDTSDAGGDTADTGEDGLADTGDDMLPDAGEDVVADGEDDGGDGFPIEVIGTPCALDAQAADLMVRSSLDVLNGAVWVELNAEERVAAFALSLIGTGQVSAGAAFLIQACAEETEYVPFCEPMFDLEGGVSCSQLGCEGADIILAHVWFNQGVGTDTTRDERATLSYALETYPGTVTYDPNPVITWRSDLSGDPEVMSATIDHSVTVAFDGGGTFDFSHEGVAQVVRPVDAEGTVEVELSFPALDNSEQAILVELALDAEGVLTGQVLRGETQIGVVSATDPESIRLEWLACN